MRSEAQQARTERDARLASWDVSKAPFTIAWELTRACPYVCRHCRADAQPRRDPNELTTQEAVALAEDLARFGPSILVLTGGDPLARPDVEEIATAATAGGLRVALTPSGTARATRARLRRLRAAGVLRVALSLDGPTAAVHDEFRGLAGSFERTLGIIRLLAEEGLPLQVNTTIARHNLALLPQMAEVVAGLGLVQWSLFFLVPTGRAEISEMISPQEHEQVFNWLYDLSRTAPFDVKATEAPAYRRVVAQRMRQATEAAGAAPQDGGAAQGGAAATAVPSVPAGAGFRFSDGLNRPAVGIGDGKGFVFISHTGEVCPSGFLPHSAGNVRERSIVDIYREDPLFLMLRDSGRLNGRCGRCEFRDLCGGSRARAYAISGDPLGEDPSCAYEPGVPA